MDGTYSLSDIAAATGNGGYGSRNDGMFGDGAWWIIVLFLFMWGRNGWGGGFGGECSGSGMQGLATRADINEGFALNGMEQGIRGIQQGICDSTYALNNSIQQGFANTNMGMMQGFNGVERGFCNLSSQIANCCCETREAIAGVNYNMSKGFCDIGFAAERNTRDIIDNANGNTRAILDFLTQDKISSLQAENQSLKLAASQSQQNAYLTATMDANTAELIRRINPTPVPAYTVPAPYPYGGCERNYSSCGCGC